jgi:acyl carrier protein
MSYTQSYTESQIEQIVKDYIVKEFMYERNNGVLSNDLNLIKARIVDSTGIIRLIYFVEDKFGFNLNLEEESLDNFATVNAIKSLVIAKLH